MKNILISPSILSADFSNLKKDILMIENAGADWLHIDVMDGHFVPNITIGPLVVKAIKKHSKLFFEVHLMITNPEKYWKNFQDAGADAIILHEEIAYDKTMLLKEMKKSGLKVGISIKPKTPAKDIVKMLPLLDIIEVMTVEPGFGGQYFMKDMLPKVSYLRNIIDEQKYNCLIEVDGGINMDTAKQAVVAGVDILVSGSSIFSADNPKKFIQDLKSIQI